MVDRIQTEERIMNIVNYIDKNKNLKPLLKNLKLFSLEELLQLKEFLETGNYKTIYELLDKKIKEYLEIIQEIKQIKIGKKLENYKQKEIHEQQTEQINLELMLA